MQESVLIDGQAAEAAWIRDRGFQFGDGLFETIAFRDGGPCLWEGHVDRLLDGCTRLGLVAPPVELLHAECMQLCAGLDRAVLKLYITAGDSERGYRRPDTVACRRILQRSNWPYLIDRPSWRVRICRQRVGENPALAGIKHLNRLEQVLARAECDDAATDEGVMLGQDGRVVSGTMSNLFAQFGGVLVTPRIDGAGIAGVVRRLIIELGRQHGWEVREDRVDPDKLRSADALFMTNSLVGIARVVSLDDTELDQTVPVHPAIDAARALSHVPGAAS
ncbi:MAG: aminodeoxychorismate lyase [Chromatiaceae bacterium]|nr:aminodeoxychorismate lyase [Chromatiaceae bacterium]